MLWENKAHSFKVASKSDEPNSRYIENSTLSVLIFASLNFRGNKISRELIREIREKNAKSAKFNSREIRKKIGIREIREI